MVMLIITKNRDILNKTITMHTMAMDITGMNKETKVKSIQDMDTTTVMVMDTAMGMGTDMDMDTDMTNGQEKNT